MVTLTTNFYHTIPLRDVFPNVNFEQEARLNDDGLIESIDFISIVAAMMDVFDIEITVNDLLPENINSMNDMIMFVEKKM